MNTEEYVVYVLDDNDNIFDICGDGFLNIIDARNYIEYLKKIDAERLINDKYAIYLKIEIKIE